MKQTLDRTYKNFIIETITSDGYLEAEPTTKREKVQFLKDTFYSEYGWRVDQVGEHKAMIDYLQGLASVLPIPFYNCDILELTVKFDSLRKDATEKQEDKILENYWIFMAVKVIQLFGALETKKSTYFDEV